MRYYILCCIILLILSCNTKEKQEAYSSDFDFLIGDWERTNTKPGVVTMEHWTITSPTEYLGHGYTLEKKDTTFQERMRLARNGNSWVLEVSGPNEEAVAFEVTRFGPNYLTAQNPNHDFPKKIAYSHFDDTLSAKVSNDDTEISFIFWKLAD